MQYSTEISVIVMSLILYFVMVMVQQANNTITGGPSYSLSNREKKLDSPLARRLADNVRNSIESLIIYVPLVLIIEVLNLNSDLTANGSWVYLISRIAFSIFFIFGVFALRSVAWMIGVIGIIMIAWPLLTSLFG